MKLALALSLKQKPLATCLVTEGGGYNHEAITCAVNAARLHGHAQVLAQYDALVHGSLALESAQKAQAAIKALSLTERELEVKITEVSEGLVRIDVFCKK